MRRSPSDLLIAVVALLLIGFYLWTASGGYSFREARRDGYYNALTAALLAGQLHLREPPNPQMFELGTPYEPGRNTGTRLHDASLYHGRYYLYFGVVPALVLFAPWRILGLGELPEPLAAAFFAAGGLLFWLAVLRRLFREHLPGTPAWMEAGAAVLLGVASVVPFILRHPVIYEVAIAAGYFFLAGAVYFFLSADGGYRLRLSRIGLGSLFLGLAVGCRPNLLAAVPLVPLLALPAWRASRGRRRGALLAAAVPFGVCLFLLGLYNHARFGSWTEFGARYQLGGMRPVSWFDPRAVPVAFYFHFLAPPDLRLDFPFVFPRTDYPGEAPEGFFMTADITGLLFQAPFVLVLLVAPLLLRGAPVEDGDRLRWRLGVLAVAGLVLPVLTSFVFASAAMRFEAEFATLLVLPALVLVAVADRRASPPRRRLLRTAVLVLAAWASFSGFALSLQGTTDGLRTDNPPLFAALERRFEPLRVAAGRLLVRDSRGVVRIRIAFPERAAAEREPVLSSGTKERSDVLWARQAGPGLFRLELQPASGPPLLTPPLAFAPGRFYDFEIEIDHLRRLLRARVDGREAFALAAPVGTVHPNLVVHGRGPRGRGATDLGRFSGTIIPEPMIWAGPPGLESLPPISPLPAVHTEEPEDKPAAPVAGRLWIPAGKEGAYLFANPEWRWIPRVFVDRVGAERTLTFAAQPAGTVEPILASGQPPGADAVYARHLGAGRVALGLARWRLAPGRAEGAWELGPAGPPFSLDPGRARRLSVVLDRAGGEVTAHLDDREALRVRSDLAPLDRALVAVGRSPEGLVLGRGTFSGRLERVR